MRILMLGARSPACLEWVRLLGTAQHQIYVADSLVWPLARFSRFCQKYFPLPSPRHHFNLWQRTLNEIVRLHQIDHILPTNEEIFYLAKAKPLLPKETTQWVEDFSLLAQLHNKFEFIRMLANLPIGQPETHLIRCANDFNEFKSQFNQLVLKPVYSRFASRTLISPREDQVTALTPSEQFPWVAQQRIYGRELCSYSLVNQGRLLAHSCYYGKYRAGKGASVYFIAEEHKSIRQFVSEFVQKYQFSGQIAFDFIETKDDVWVIECNPRATSGIHLFANMGHAIAAQMFNGVASNTISPSPAPRLVALGYLLYNSDKILTKAFWQDWHQATDVIQDRLDPWPARLQSIPLAEFALRALRQGSGLIQAATEDIEWDGQ